MKKIILTLALTLSASAFAEKITSIWPRVYNNGSSVQVHIWNHTENHVTCSGSIWMRTQEGNSFTEYLFESVMPRLTAYRSFYVRDFNDRIVSVNHSIFCH